jgi:major membrane immunogen (membrane-anchored lipoprotein)
MKTLTLLFASLAASVLISFGVLNKDITTTIPSTPIAIEKTSLLIDKKWKMTDETTFANGKMTNTFNDYQKCFSDDTYNFMADGGVIIDDNLIKCPNAQSQTTKGLWAVNMEDKNKLEMALSMQFTAEIMSINANTLVWKYQNQVGDVVTQTFTKQ